MTDIYGSIQVFIGVDVGKAEHHAVAVTRAGKRVFDSTLPNDEARLRSLITSLRQHGPALLVVDQPATIGALPVSVARAEDISVTYLPGLAMRRVADLQIYMPEKLKPMRATRPLSLTRLGACPTRYARLSSPASKWLSSRCSLVLTTI